LDKLLSKACEEEKVMGGMQITTTDCEEVRNRLTENTNFKIDPVVLWEEVWRSLVNKLGYGSNPDYELMLHPRNPNDPDNDDTRIASIRTQIYELLGKHSTEPRACMKVFDRL
jgi:hypothetical protein